jgi:hypothetical protein
MAATPASRSALAWPEPGNVRSLDRLRIERALQQRGRYKYVQPLVEREGLGWRVVSPNCSRNVDRHGGVIPIAWLVPASGGLWLLHARNHAQDCWRLAAWGPSLDQALTRLCADPQREFWV